LLGLIGTASGQDPKNNDFLQSLLFEKDTPVSDTETKSLIFHSLKTLEITMSSFRQPVKGHHNALADTPIQPFYVF
jgi:hypothetical protein